jgi:CO dehydrogenase maturation factor
MSSLIAVTGKGGVGKTTISAFLVRLAVEKGQAPVFAVDADPNSTLGALLGVSASTTISEIREEMLKSKAKATGIPKNRLLAQQIQEAVVEASGFDLITMGRPEGPSCYCYVNNLVRQAIASLRANYKLTVVDNEAGMEHLSRMNTDDIDCLVLVCEPTLVSARSAARISALTRGLPVTVKRRVLVWNKVTSVGVPRKAEEMLSADAFDATVFLPYDDGAAEIAVSERSVFSAPMPQAFAQLLDACTVNIKTNTSV